MSNELSDKHMLQKVSRANGVTFLVKESVDVIWMSQETIAEFFEISRKETINCLANVLKDNALDKKVHIRSVSYVKDSLSSPLSIQERQYCIK